MGPVLPMLLFACGSPTPSKGVVDTAVPEPTIEDSGSAALGEVRVPFEQRDLLTERMGLCDSASMVTAYLHLCGTDDGLFLNDERNGSSVPLGAFESHSSAHLPTGELVFALDGTLFSLENEALVAVDIDLPVPIQRIETAKDGVWLWGLGQLFRWDGAVLSQVELAGYPTIFDFVVSDDLLYLSVPWLVVVDVSADTMTTIEMDDRIPESMTVDLEGSFWFVVGEQLFVRRPGQLTRSIDLPEPVFAVTGPEVWVRGEASIYRHDGNGFSRHLVPDASMVAVDEYGRLLQVEDGHLIRRSIGRPIVVVGLSDSIVVRETAQLLPSDPETVLSLHVWLNGARLNVDGPPWSIVIEPEDLPDGTHDLRFFSESELGDALDVFPIWVGELPAVEWPEIEALSNEHCVACHGGATLTDLTTKQGWELRIDDIISQVSNQQMPLGGPFLSTEEITMIRGWKDGGFQ